MVQQIFDNIGNNKEKYFLLSVYLMYLNTKSTIEESCLLNYLIKTVLIPMPEVLAKAFVPLPDDN